MMLTYRKSRERIYKEKKVTRIGEFSKIQNQKVAHKINCISTYCQLTTGRGNFGKKLFQYY